MDHQQEAGPSALRRPWRDLLHPVAGPSPAHQLTSSPAHQQRLHPRNSRRHGDTTGRRARKDAAPAAAALLPALPAAAAVSHHHLANRSRARRHGRRPIHRHAHHTTPAAEPPVSQAPTATATATATATPAPTTPADLAFPNPFQPTKNFTTGRWHGPVYGLRKQADLVKLASAHGVVDLLPWTIKKPGEKEARRIERGLTVKGTGEGQRVKGKLWERTLKGRLEMRRQAMLDMPRLIQEWKQRGHGRGWKKWPSGKAKK
ncbi:uncharacterized protein EKO05_0007974 [Ascochyta rabiei]|uniref:uncharacterized protein n=1 Tax=Didymella rabiei TaxID=5454 RepID=UPI001901F989|nr:uncharacterized protein EKO05_0007974 [Ascochyta rabiei]UPX17632.1 hypothetical protein EKO05_0007974 [Ascochyta rabiei]